jgi:hypothetical protein
MNQVTKEIIPHFEALLKWIEEGLSHATLPYTFHQYMKLKEALESVIDSLTCFTKDKNPHLDFYANLK